jgi:bacillopeptidase F
MGLMVGGSAGGSAIGVAPGAQWIAAKIFDDAGLASTSAIHQAFQWVLDPDGDPATNDSADVVNNSWSLRNIGSCSIEYEVDIQTLKAAQVAVVFSGGNYGPYASTSVSPANNPNGFAVGAVDDLDQAASFSSSGPSACDGSTYPEVVAPGVAVRTADLTFGGTIPDPYTSVDGTSFSAPHVSGAMALLLSAYPSATVGELEQSLEDTAVDLGASGPDNAYGHGRIDVLAASSWLADPPAPVCTDLDGDGFFAESVCSSQVDCNDLDAAINPAACDIKSDGIDQDCDGVDRTGGKPCPSSGGGGGGGGGGDTSGIEGKGQTCSDGIDNDGDGAIDCGDSDCFKNKACR